MKKIIAINGNVLLLHSVTLIENTSVHPNGMHYFWINYQGSKVIEVSNPNLPDLVRIRKELLLFIDSDALTFLLKDGSYGDSKGVIDIEHMSNEEINLIK